MQTGRWLLARTGLSQYSNDIHKAYIRQGSRPFQTLVYFYECRMFNVLPTGWSHSGGAPTPWLMAGAAVHAKQQKAPLTLPLLRIDPFAYKTLPAVFALKATQGQEQLFPWVEEPCGTFLSFSFFYTITESQCTQPGLMGFGTALDSAVQEVTLWG